MGTRELASSKRMVGQNIRSASKPNFAFLRYIPYIDLSCCSGLRLVDAAKLKSGLDSEPRGVDRHVEGPRHGNNALAIGSI
jgi:hypothetical protein